MEKEEYTFKAWGKGLNIEVLITEIEDSRKQNEVEQNEVDDSSEDEEPVIPISVKAEMPFVNPMELMEEVKRGMINN